MIIQFIVFLTLSTLICRGMDISKYFNESLGFRDNESRLYIEVRRTSSDCVDSQADVGIRCSHEKWHKGYFFFALPFIFADTCGNQASQL